MAIIPNDALSSSAVTILTHAQEIAAQHGLLQVTPAVVLVSLLDDPAVQTVTRYCGILPQELQKVVSSLLPQNQERVSDTSPDFSPDIESILELAIDELFRMPPVGLRVVSPIHLLLGIIRFDDEQTDGVLRAATMTHQRVRSEIMRLQ